MSLLLHQQLETDKTVVTPITTEIAQGMIARDQMALETESRLRFPNPFQIPPMMDDFLPAAVQRLQYNPGEVGWWGWLFFEKESRKVLGSVGVSGPPDVTGGVGIAFSIYESFENQGYTKQATKAVVDWILAQKGVTGDENAVYRCSLKNLPDEPAYLACLGPAPVFLPTALVRRIIGPRIGGSARILAPFVVLDKNVVTWTSFATTVVVHEDRVLAANNLAAGHGQVMT